MDQDFFNFVNCAKDQIKTKNYKSNGIKKQKGIREKINKVLNMIADTNNPEDIDLFSKVAMDLLLYPSLTLENLEETAYRYIHKRMENAKSIEFDYIEDFKSGLEEYNQELLKKFNEIPLETAHMLNKAFNRVENIDAHSYISGNQIDKRKLFSELMMNLLSSDNSYETLLKFPRHLKLELSLSRATPITDRRKIKRQYFDDLHLKAQFLLNLSKNSNTLNNMFGLTNEKIFSRYYKPLRKHVKTNVPKVKLVNLTPFENAILMQAISIDHIKNRSDFGVFGKDYTEQYDPSFKETVFEPNMASNMYVLPDDKNREKDAFIGAQFTEKGKYRADSTFLFLNIVPMRGPDKNFYIYPDIRAFESNIPANIKRKTRNNRRNRKPKFIRRDYLRKPQGHSNHPDNS